MMLDDNLVAASPASFYRVLKKASLLDLYNRKPSKKGTGFVQPLQPHEHWHVDVAYINIAGTFYFLEIAAERDRKLDEARQRRQAQRQAAHQAGQQATPRPAARPSIDFTALRQTVPLIEVLHLLHFEPVHTSGQQQRGPCPLHGSRSSRSRCFSTNLADHTFQCFKCGKAGNQLDLWAAATHQSVYDAARDLCNKLNRPLPLRTSPTMPRNREEEPVAIASGTCTTEPAGVP
jgi:hypothetical protein